MSKPKLENNEILLGTWTLNHIPPSGGRVLGKLYVTNNRLLLDGKYDLSLDGMLDEINKVSFDSISYLEILKESIQSVNSKSSFFNKKVMVTLMNGQEHVFDYGLLSVKKLEAAIKS